MHRVSLCVGIGRVRRAKAQRVTGLQVCLLPNYARWTYACSDGALALPSIGLLTLAPFSSPTPRPPPLLPPTTTHSLPTPATPRPPLRHPAHATCYSTTGGKRMAENRKGKQRATPLQDSAHQGAGDDAPQGSQGPHRTLSPSSAVLPPPAAGPAPPAHSTHTSTGTPLPLP